MTINFRVIYFSFFPEAYRQFINRCFCGLHDKNPIVLPIIISISY
jgi:hypothetical protein